MKRNKGITLIALVITIIVLLILAGVAISMLSGENGTLKKAAEAKIKTEQAQKEEETTSIDYEIDSHFILKNSKYKCRYGCITGITTVKGEVQDTVGDLNGALPSGYSISEDGVTEDSKIKTGMKIQKDGKTVARTVVIGEADGNGTVTFADATTIRNALQGGSLNKERLAEMDIDRDNEITELDVLTLIKWNAGNGENIDEYQNKYATNPVIYTNQQLEEKCRTAIEEKFKGSNYSLEWSSTDECYLLKGANTENKVGDILNLLGNDESLIIEDEQSKEKTADQNIAYNDTIEYVYRDGRKITICYVDF